MNLKLNNGADPSFWEIYRNTANVLLLSNARYSCLWCECASDLQQACGGARLLRDVIRDSTVPLTVLTFYPMLCPPPLFWMEKYINYFIPA